MMRRKVAMAADHGGFHLKTILIEFLKKLGREVADEREHFQSNYFSEGHLREP